MRRNGFIKGKGRRVARTRHDAEHIGTDGRAEFGEVGRPLKRLDENVNDPAGTQAGGENAGGNDEPQNAAVALPHAVKEPLCQIRRTDARHDHGVDHADQHGCRHGNLHLREPDGHHKEQYDRQKRRKSPEQISLFGQLHLVCRVVNAVVLEAPFLIVAKEQTGRNHHDDADD